MKNKKGVSGIIATVILILIVVATVSIIATILIPFIEKSLDNEDKLRCLDIVGKLELVYADSCSSNSVTEVKVVRKGGEQIDKIYILLEEESGEVNKKEIEDVPDSGGGFKVYLFNDDKVYKKASVGAIIGSENCQISDQINLKEC
jgi:flagellin-like protein